MIRATIVTLCVILAATAGFSQVSFTVAPDRVRTTKAEPITVTATLQASKNLGTVPMPAIPKSDAFDIVSSNRNQSSSSSIQIINGAASQTEEVTYYFYYTVAPKKLGAFTFPSLTVAAGGKEYTSQPFTVEVSAAPVSSPDVVVLLSVSKSAPYLGEQCLLTVRVCQKPNAQVQLSNEGFVAFVQALEKELSRSFSYTMLSGGKIARSQEIVNGEQYLVFKVPYALFPTSAGTLTIGSIPFQYNAIARSSRRGADPFDAFFGGGFFGGGVEAVAKQVMSNTVAVNAHPLPPAPADFAGAVGRFTIAASVDPHQVAAGDAVTLKVTIAGNNRPATIGDIKLSALKDIEAFTPEKTTAIDTTASGINGRKTFKFLLIPHQEGTISVPPLSFTFFDPAVGSYQTVHSEAFPLEVSRGKEGSKPQTRYLTQQDIREVGHDIRYIKTPKHLATEIDKPYRNPIFFVVYPLPFVLIVFSILFKIQSEQKTRNPGFGLRRRALATTLRQLDSIHKKQALLGGPEFLGQAIDALAYYLTHKFGFAAQGKTNADLAAALLEAGVAKPVVDELALFLERFDAYRFSGGQLDAAVKSESLDAERTLILAIEKTVPRRKK